MPVFSRRGFLASSALGLFASQLPLRTSASWRELLQPDPVTERRKSYLDLITRLLQPTTRISRTRLNGQGDRTFEQWQERTGELPPDFLTMPSMPLLPDPLMLIGEKEPQPIVNARQWATQRERIRELYHHWIVGTMPPAPRNIRAETLSTEKEGDVTVHRIRISFGPDNSATLRLQLQVPPGEGPFPVLLTNHQRGRPWVNTAVRRGYMGCIYQARDRSYGETDDSEPWQAIYPEYDFSAIGRWAWGGMRAVDYLMTLPYVDKNRIAIGGHSRNAKQALLAAAFDDRIGAVVDSRGNTGASMPWRFTEDMFVQESIEELTGGVPHWFHPRLRFFVGREHKLPIEQNLLLSLVAPRGLLMSHAFMEHQGNPMGVEQSYRSVKRVYDFLGRPERIGLYQQPGEHPSSAEDIERYFDFFDTVFGRAQHPRPEIWVHGYSYDEWTSAARERIDPEKYPVRAVGDFLPAGLASGMTPELWAPKKADILERVRWALGTEPPKLHYAVRGGGNTLTSEGWRGQLFDRPGAGYDAASVPFGDDLRGFIYWPPRPPAPRPDSTAARTDTSAARDSTAARDTTARVAVDTTAAAAAAAAAAADSSTGAGADGSSANQGQSAGARRNMPVVIWLHPYCYSMGFSRYVYWGPLYQRGFAVFAFDQIGFGTRTEYSDRFYDRHPHWSLLGKMVADTRAAIDYLADNPGRFDMSRVYLQGYALGAKVALFTAALDERVAGITISCGFTPLRPHTPEDGTEGVYHYSHLHGLMPRLGSFAGKEDRLPIDFDEIIATVAPRPVQIIQPTVDRHANLEHVRQTVDAARRAYDLYDAGDKLVLDTPENFNRYPAVWDPQVDWVTEAAGLRVPRRRGRGGGGGNGPVQTDTLPGLGTVSY